MNWPPSRRRRLGSHVSASQLAAMGVCERLVVFEHRYGKRPSRPQRLALERGRRAHQSFLRQASPDKMPGPSGLTVRITRLVAASLRRCMLWCRMAWWRMWGDMP